MRAFALRANAQFDPHSPTLAKHAERRLAWSGGAYNPPATAAYYDRDPEWVRATTALGAGPATGTVSATPLVVVCAHLPPFDTSRFALPALLHVATLMGERTLPVHLDNPVLATLVSKWRAVRAAAAAAAAATPPAAGGAAATTDADKPPATLAEALGDEQGNEVRLSTALLSALHAVVNDTSK